MPAGWGFGYFNDQNELTHFVYGRLKGANGPFDIERIAYQNAEQLRELISLMGSLGDQVSRIVLIEPPHVQLQDFLRQPFRFRRLSKGSNLESYHRASAFWQARILNLEACITKTHLLGPEISFNLVLTDPLGKVLAEPDEVDLSGQYVIHLGESSTVQCGTNADLPTLSATINAFTRLWLGVRPATELAVSDELEGDDDLLESLDDSIRLPPARLGWYF